MPKTQRLLRCKAQTRCAGHLLLFYQHSKTTLMQSLSSPKRMSNTVDNDGSRYLWSFLFPLCTHEPIMMYNEVVCSAAQVHSTRQAPFGFSQREIHTTHGQSILSGSAATNRYVFRPSNAPCCTACPIRIRFDGPKTVADKDLTTSSTPSPSRHQSQLAVMLCIHTRSARHEA